MAQNPWWRDPEARRARRYPNRRQVFERLKSRLESRASRRATLLLGPRQVGKTRLLWQVADSLLDGGWPPRHVTYFDFSDDRITAEVSPREVVTLAPAPVRPDLPHAFLFDEVEYFPNWAQWLKQAVDEERHAFLVTGSAASVLRQGSIESGLGRWDEIPIEGLSFQEYLTFLGRGEGAPSEVYRRTPNALDRYLIMGGFPEHVGAEDPRDVLRKLREDIAEKAIRKDLLRWKVDVERVKALFVHLVESSGSEFSREARASDVGANVKSIDEWVGLLEQTHLIKPLRRYALASERGSVKPSKRLRPKTRFYAADHGLISAFCSVDNPLNDPVLRGQIYEAVVFRHLREVIRELREEAPSYYRDEKGREIDFLLHLGKRVVAVEVTSRPDAARKASGLAGAGKRARADKLLVIHGGVSRESRDGMVASPLHEFLLDPVGTLRQEP